MQLTSCLQTIQQEWRMSKSVLLFDFDHKCLTDLSHEAGVWEPKPESGDEHDDAVWGHEPRLPGERLPDGRGRGEVQEHQEVRHGGRHKSQDQYWLSSLFRCHSTDKSK